MFHDILLVYFYRGAISGLNLLPHYFIVWIRAQYPQHFILDLRNDYKNNRTLQNQPNRALINQRKEK